MCCAGIAAFLPGLPGTAVAAPLFDSQETLSVIIEAPIAELLRQRKKEPELAGTLRYTDAAGEEFALDIILETRGNSRLEFCDFPPLKIRLDPKQTAGTLFEGQRRLKLVTKCMRSRSADDWLSLELGAYRAFNVITPRSYRTRQLVVTYRDPESRRHDLVDPAFFIEADRLVGKRLELKRIRPPQVDPAQMSLAHTTHNMLFQYLIANTDFSVKQGPSGEGCCHNARVFARAGTQRDFTIIPFDFDQAGIVNTGYGIPADGLGIRKVTTRLYRGFCWQNEALLDSIGLFNENRSRIEAAFLSDGLSRSRSRRLQRYIDGFYDTINDPKELQKRLLDKCRGPESLALRASPVSPEHIKTPE